MNRRIHWFLVVSFSSLMLFGLDTCYGVGDKDPSNFLFNFVYSSQVNGERKGDLLKENLIDRYRISKEDLKKVEKGFFTLREIISAKTDLIQFIQECDSATVENSRKIALLQLSANFGNETAINHLLLPDHCLALHTFLQCLNFLMNFFEVHTSLLHKLLKDFELLVHYLDLHTFLQGLILLDHLFVVHTSYIDKLL